MARPEATRLVAADHVAARRLRTRRLRRLVFTLLAIAIVVPILVLALDSASPSRPLPLPGADRLLEGAPTQRVIALQDELRLYLPVADESVTAFGYHAVGAEALALEPVGEQANAGLFTRLLRRLDGGESTGIRYYLLGGEPGAETAGLDIGAPARTDVYAPVDGTVIAISERVINGVVYGVRIDIQPVGSPSLVVSVQNIDVDAALSVGSTVASARTRIGAIIDLSAAERPALAEYTQDAGTHVHIEVRPAVNLTLQ